jgi:hypothetical protein
VDVLSEREIRAAFVNCSRGEASRINLPADLDEPGAWRWEAMDFLGWVDPRAPQQAALVVPGERGPLGVRLRRNASGGGGRTRMCSLCCTVHPGSGVALMVANRAGKAGRDGNTVGVDVCADLRCSGYVRGWAPLPVVSLVEETTTVEQKVERLQRNLDAFVRRVLR